MAITAITNRIWIKLLVAIPATTPKNPNTQIIIQITATNQSKLLMMLWFLCYILKLGKKQSRYYFKRWNC